MKTRGRKQSVFVNCFPVFGYHGFGHKLELYINSFSNESERCCEKSVYTGRGINLEKCVFSGCNITFVVDDKK